MTYFPAVSEGQKCDVGVGIGLEKSVRSGQEKNLDGQGEHENGPGKGRGHEAIVPYGVWLVEPDHFADAKDVALRVLEPGRLHAVLLDYAALVGLEIRQVVLLEADSASFELFHG
jgi:2-keto-4-pentenoate hydratase/2-oxohepta-3-ene-1,7-dioic acid hydratase in catechol pathway